MVGLSVLCLIATLVGLVNMDQVHGDPMTFPEGSVLFQWKGMRKETEKRCRSIHPNTAPYSLWKCDEEANVPPTHSSWDEGTALVLTEELLLDAAVGGYELY